MGNRVSKKIIQGLQWALVNGIFIFLLWASYYSGWQNAGNLQNVLTFSVFVLCIFTLIPLLAIRALIKGQNSKSLDKMRAKLLDQNSSFQDVPSWIDTSYDALFLAGLLYAGAMASATAYFLHIIFLYTIRDSIEELREVHKRSMN